MRCELALTAVLLLTLVSACQRQGAPTKPEPAEPSPPVVSETSDPQSMLAALRSPAVETRNRARELLLFDTPARRGLMRLAEHPNARSRDATDAVAWLTRDPQPSLRSFYRNRLVAISKTQLRDDAATTQALDLSAALGAVGNIEDMTVLGTGIEWLVAADESGRSRVTLNDWSFSRLVVATVALADNAGSDEWQYVEGVRNFVDADIGHRTTAENRAINYQQAGLVFATKYADQLNAGRSTKDALIRIYAESDDYLVRVAAMNSLRVVGKILTADTRLYTIFPFRSQREIERYIDNVFVWSLQNLDLAGGQPSSIEVLLSDGSLATAPLTGEQLDREIQAKRAALTAAGEVWPTNPVSAIAPVQSLTPYLLTRELSTAEMFRDRRLERPITGGIQ